MSELKDLQEWLSGLGEDYTLEQLNNLTWLNLSFHHLTNLPESICKLENLEILYLSGNQLTGLPENFCKLKKLEELYLDNNQLFINKKHTQLIELLNKFGAHYTLVEDTLLTDVLI